MVQQMTNRERFRHTLLFKESDRLPYFEEGIRSDVIRAWRKKGLSSRKMLYQQFPSDPSDEIQIDLDPYPPLYSEIVDLDRFKKHFNPDTRRRWPWNWGRCVASWKKNDHIRILRVHRGFFLALGVHSWEQFEEVIILTLERPDYVREYLRLYSLFCTEIASRVLDDVQIDAALFSEPIGGKEGPLLSPAIYRSLVLPTYKPVYDLLKERGVEIFIFRTYANAALLLPALVEFGFNCLWACEPNIQDMNYRIIRNRFGEKLSLIGGINIDCLRAGKEQIRSELEQKVPDLLKSGGYIPLADGRIRADISFDNYRYYRQMLIELTKRQGMTRVKE
jgi:uroporphyrinogen decarboxylase